MPYDTPLKAKELAARRSQSLMDPPLSELEASAMSRFARSFGYSLALTYAVPSLVRRVVEVSHWRKQETGILPVYAGSLLGTLGSFGSIWGVAYLAGEGHTEGIAALAITNAISAGYEAFRSARGLEARI